MADVKKYCNNAIFIADGMISESGDVDKVAEKYIASNLDTLNSRNIHSSNTDNSSSSIRIVGNKSIIHHGEYFEADIEYSYSGDAELYVAYTLQDEGRGGRVYDSGHMKVSSDDSALKIRISLDNFNSTDFRVVAVLYEKNKDHSKAIANTFDGGDFRFKYLTTKTDNDYGLVKKNIIE